MYDDDNYTFAVELHYVRKVGHLNIVAGFCGMLLITINPPFTQ